MSNLRTPNVAIVDYGMGNLYSVQRACEFAGLCAHITSSPSDVEAADAVILPGVGAFSDAMDSLRQSGMADVLRAVAASNKPFLGICLGFQLLMTVSFEFGRHQGLGNIPGSVIRFENSAHSSEPLKVPQVGWNQVWKLRRQKDNSQHTLDPWLSTPLEGMPDGEYMYFVHSLYVVPEDPKIVLSNTRYGNIEFCSSLCLGNVFACQFHPERSGPQGLRIYHNLAAKVHGMSV